MAEEVEMRARELLAAEYRQFGLADNAEGLADEGPANPEEQAALRAIIAALTPSPDRQAERDKALEEAARVADSHSRFKGAPTYTDAPKMIAAKIRALIGKAPQ